MFCTQIFWWLLSNKERIRKLFAVQAGLFTVTESGTHSGWEVQYADLCSDINVSMCSKYLCKFQRTETGFTFNPQHFGRSCSQSKLSKCFFSLLWKFLNYSKTPTLCKIAQYCVPLSHILLTFDISIGVFYKNKLLLKEKCFSSTSTKNIVIVLVIKKRNMQVYKENIKTNKLHSNWIQCTCPSHSTNL